MLSVHQTVTQLMPGRETRVLCEVSHSGGVIKGKEALFVPSQTMVSNVSIGDALYEMDSDGHVQSVQVWQTW